MGLRIWRGRRGGTIKFPLRLPPNPVRLCRFDEHSEEKSHGGEIFFSGRDAITLSVGLIVPPGGGRDLVSPFCSDYLENIMISDNILNALGPCGLHCEKCFAHIDGEIRKYSSMLLEKLGNFDIYAKRFETLLDNPIFSKYPDFKMMLEYFASENCKGCRKETCKLFKNCGVRHCHQEKNIDFCFQCEDFPCTKTNFDSDLEKRWVQLNSRIKEVGIEAYFSETKDKPRY